MFTAGTIALMLLAAQPVSPAGTARGQAPARTLMVAAAADLQTVLPELLVAFARTNGIAATPSFGSSGNFFAQIQNGAPYDVFLSADVEYPKRLVAAGQADPDSLYAYATGRLVLWTRHDSGVDLTGGLAVLADGRVKRVAIANPDLAPYGRAAEGALKQAGVYDAVRPKLVLGQNVAQTAQLADSGNADVALIGHALALGPALRASGHFVEVPAATYPPIVQAAVVITASAHKAEARALLDFLRTADARRTLERFGFGPPSAP